MQQFTYICFNLEMTTIEYGGGPNLDQRRSFAGLKDGSMVPGYGGYCPQLKFDHGKTYGQNTFDISEQRRSKHPITASIYEQPIMTKIHPDGNIPESTGDNKYTKNMKPGYTGYIPRWPFKFGSTYREECDVCLDEHFGNVYRQAAKEEDMKRSFGSFPHLQPINGDPEVKNHLNTYSDGLLRANQKADKRTSVEPPIPGYKGFVPRIYTTELGLGCRYHDMTRNGLESFYSNLNRRRSGGKTVTFGEHAQDSNRMLSRSTTNLDDSTKRVYKQDGMIPKYTGYLPQKRYNFGYTYGDTSRSLDVCAHSQECYGEYLKTIRQSPYVA